MIKILVYGMTSNYGGIEVYLVNLLKSIDKTKIQIDYIIIGENSPFEKEIRANGGEVYYIPDKKKELLKNIKSMTNLFKKLHHKHDYIYFNSGALFYGIPYLLALVYKFRKIIVHAHNGKDTSRKEIEIILHKINRIIINYIADIKFSCSDLATEWIFGKKYIGNTNLYKINNSVDCEKYRYSHIIRTQIRKELNIEDDILVFGNVGRLDYQKNHIFLLKIFKEIVKYNNKSILLIIGDGILKNTIINEAEKYGLLEKIKFLGNRNDVDELLNAMDAFILPSLFEGFPITLVEAQVNGLPCFISSNISNEVNKTGLVNFINLNQDPDKWASDILGKMSNFDREKYYFEMKELGYDLKDNVNYFEEILMRYNNKVDVEEK